MLGSTEEVNRGFENLSQILMSKVVKLKNFQRYEDRGIFKDMKTGMFPEEKLPSE